MESSAAAAAAAAAAAGVVEIPPPDEHALWPPFAPKRRLFLMERAQVRNPLENHELVAVAVSVGSC